MKEFFKRNLAITVGVSLHKYFVNGQLIDILAQREHLFQLILGYGHIAVLVKHIEGSTQFFLTQKLLLVHRGDNEFGIVDLSGAIDVDLGIDLIDHLICHVDT